MRERGRERGNGAIRFQMTHNGVCKDTLTVCIIKHLGEEQQAFHVQAADDAMFHFCTSRRRQDSAYNIKQRRVSVSTSLN